MNINYLKRAALFLAMGSVMFLFSCSDDDTPSVPDAPVAGFTTEVDGATVSFTNTTTGTVDTYAWDFGDGSAGSSAQSPADKSYTATGSYTITLTATNEGGSDTASETIMITVAMTDTEGPIITLNGDLGADFDIELGADFTDPGATATDNVDGEVAVVVGGDQVNTAEAGTYVITYDATDAAMNAADQVTRTVRVRYPDGLVTNGDFQSATTDPWYVNFPDPDNTAANEVPTETVMTNTFFNAADIVAAANAFEVNMSQIVTLEQGKTYELSFDASSNVDRTIIAGIGLAGGSFANNSVSQAITTTSNRYTLTLEANFGEDGVDNRVLFDLGGENGTVVLDNIALIEVEGNGGSAAPTDAPDAPPARDAEDVISIYGEAYGTAIGLNNVDWDEGSNATEETIAGNNVLKLSFVTFLGNDLGSEVDASGMTHVHMDIWIADEFTAGQVFLPKWSNHNGGSESDAFEYTYAVGGDDSQKWLSIDVALADWNNVLGSGADARANLKQLVIGVAGTLDVVYMDNVYFYNDGTGSGGGGGGTGTAPTDAPDAPPARDADDVISIYGDAYGTAIGLNNVDWDEGSDAVEESHAGNSVLKLSFNNFLGTDLGSEVDASGMTHVHMDIWIADAFNAGQVFLPKWSNHNGGGETDAFEYTYAVGGDDSQKWLSIDVALADWNNVLGAGADARANLKQLVVGVSGTLDVVYMDNVYFYNDGTGSGGGGGGGGGGSDAAPTDAPTAPPARDAADVISIYGDAYGTAIGLNNVSWDEGSEATEETHAGNNVLKLSFETFLGTDLGSEVDASGMTHVHFDFWIADAFNAGQVFLPKWSNHNGGGETDAFEYTYAVGGDDSQKWLSIDVPVADWNNVLGGGPDARANLKQLVIGVSATLDLVYMDNVYFYKE